MSEKGKEAGRSNDDGGFKTFLYNSATGECLGRTGSSWFKILVFYLIFYILLAAFWALLLFIFYQTLDPHRPKWQLDASRIGSNPGLGFRPRPPETKIESTLIWFSSGVNGNYQPYVENLESFLKEYTQDSGPSGKGDAVATADDCRAGKPPVSGKYCPFNYKDQGFGKDACNANNKFGYELGNPCILIKINKIFGWVPNPLTEKPANMPSFNGTITDGVVITCEGENPADKENIGPIEYTPSQTIRSNFFPFENQHGYLSPFVMVRFANPSRGVLINIECKAWAKNIKHDRSEREGSVHFELLID